MDFCKDVFHHHGRVDERKRKRQDVHLNSIQKENSSVYIIYIPESLPKSADDDDTCPERDERGKEHCEEERKPALRVHTSPAFGQELRLPKGLGAHQVDRHGVRTSRDEDGRVFVRIFVCANVDGATGVPNTRANDGGVVSGRVSLANDGFDVFVRASDMSRPTTLLPAASMTSTCRSA
jgi:hypothetical protein